jgi:hypothetical protein
MITLDEARLKIESELQRYGQRSGPEELVILDEHTIERSWGWVFFYTSRGWRDGDFQYALAGNAPIIVNRLDGTLRHTGTALPVEDYISEYEAELDRQQGAWELLIQEPQDTTPHILSRIRDVLCLSVTETGTLKKKLPCVWSVGAKKDLEPILVRLQSAGVSAEIRRCDRPR